MSDSVTDFMSRDHRHCDDLLARTEELASKQDWEAAFRKFAAFRAAIDRHLAMEEEVLFPAFEEATGMDGGPTYVMRAEHEQMRHLLAEMSDALTARDKDAFLGASETLNILTQQHNMKEENMLYPMSDEALGHEAPELVLRMRSQPD